MSHEYDKENLASSHSKALCSGIKNGFPIGMGYFAVAFSLGIMAKSAGLSPGQGFLASILTNASAGQYAVFTLIGVNASYLSVAMITLVANGRYLLMSCALSQRFAPDTPLIHRFIMGQTITDEIFGITISRPGYLDPFYSYGALLIASPLWASGTAIGIIAGNVLPLRIVSALSVALYGMFLAVIVPPSRKSKIVASVVIVSFAASFAASRLPIVSNLSEGNRTIILTIGISAVAALLFPVDKLKGAEESDS